MLTNEETCALLELASDLTAVAMDCAADNSPDGIRDDLLALVERIEDAANPDNERHNCPTLTQTEWNALRDRNAERAAAGLPPVSA